MKDPKTLFPFLFISSWVGNAFLTVLAFYLAFTHDGPLSPTVFLTVAICILSGNLLPIAVYWLFITWRAAELKAESMEASVRVRDALRRSEDIMGRLDETEGSLAKTILVARQVPERIRESFEELLAIGAKLDSAEFSSFVETLSTLTEAIQSVTGAVENSHTSMQKLEKDLKGIPHSLEKILEVSRAESAKPVEEVDASVGERLDMLFESMESVQDQMDAMLGRLVELKAAAHPPQKKTPKKAATKKEPVPVETETVEQKSLDLEISSEHGEGSVLTLRKDQVRIVAHAMVGISNKLFIRGDEPWLSWDQGIPMNLIGIGEFAWSGDDIKDGIEVSIRLNDEIEAIGGTLKLEPGKPVEVSPRFP